MLVFLVSAIAKIVYTFMLWPFSFPDIITKVVGNAIWFSFGMILTDDEIRRKILNRAIMIMCFIIGVTFSLIFYHVQCSSVSVQFIIAVILVYAFVCLFATVIDNKGENITMKLNKYFMSVFLMHTIFAAGFRTILLRIGITSFLVHFSIGLLVSILVPVLVYEIARRKWWLLFWIEPLKAIRMKREIYV